MPEPAPCYGWYDFFLCAYLAQEPHWCELHPELCERLREWGVDVAGVPVIVEDSSHDRT